MAVHAIAAREVEWRDTKRYAWLLGAVIPAVPFLAWGLVEWTGQDAFWYFGPFFVFVLIPTTGEFVAPSLVGGSDDSMFGNFIQDSFVSTTDWALGAVMAMWLMAVVVVLIAVSARYLTADLRGPAR